MDGAKGTCTAAAVRKLRLLEHHPANGMAEFTWASASTRQGLIRTSCSLAERLSISGQAGRLPFVPEKINDLSFTHLGLRMAFKQTGSFGINVNSTLLFARLVDEVDNLDYQRERSHHRSPCFVSLVGFNRAVCFAFRMADGSGQNLPVGGPQEAENAKRYLMTNYGMTPKSIGRSGG